LQVKALLKVAAPALAGLSSKLPPKLSSQPSQPEAPLSTVTSSIKDEKKKEEHANIEVEGKVITPPESEAKPDAIAISADEIMNDTTDTTTDATDDTTISAKNTDNKKRKIGAPVLENIALSSAQVEPKPKRVLGPAMPPPRASNPDPASGVSSAKPSIVSHTAEAEDGVDLNWCPPTGQSGDGKTHLNAKFGY
jgi:hypothetical protein